MGLTAAMKYQSQLDLKAYGLFVVPSRGQILVQRAKYK
jgi:hypothetical protein